MDLTDWMLLLYNGTKVLSGVSGRSQRRKGETTPSYGRQLAIGS